MKRFNGLSIGLGVQIISSLIIVNQNVFSLFYDTPTSGYLPLQYYLIVTFFNTAALFIGGMLPIIMGSDRLKDSLLIGAIATLLGIVNTYYISTPVWYKAVSVLTIIPFSYLGGLTIQKMYVTLYE